MQPGNRQALRCVAIAAMRGTAVFLLYNKNWPNENHENKNQICLSICLCFFFLLRGVLHRQMLGAVSIWILYTALTGFLILSSNVKTTLKNGKHLKMFICSFIFSRRVFAQAKVDGVMKRSPGPPGVPFATEEVFLVVHVRCSEMCNLQIWKLKLWNVETVVAKCNRHVVHVLP